MSDIVRRTCFYNDSSRLSRCRCSGGQSPESLSANHENAIKPWNGCFCEWYSFTAAGTDEITPPSSIFTTPACLAMTLVIRLQSSNSVDVDELCFISICVPSKIRQTALESNRRAHLFKEYSRTSIYRPSIYHHPPYTAPWNNNKLDIPPAFGLSRFSCFFFFTYFYNMDIPPTSIYRQNSPCQKYGGISTFHSILKVDCSRVNRVDTFFRNAISQEFIYIQYNCFISSLSITVLHKKRMELLFVRRRRKRAWLTEEKYFLLRQSNRSETSGAYLRHGFVFNSLHQ